MAKLKPEPVPAPEQPLIQRLLDRLSDLESQMSDAQVDIKKLCDAAISETSEINARLRSIESQFPAGVL